MLLLQTLCPHPSLPARHFNPSGPPFIPNPSSFPSWANWLPLVLRLKLLRIAREISSRSDVPAVFGQPKHGFELSQSDPSSTYMSLPTIPGTGGKRAYWKSPRTGNSASQTALGHVWLGRRPPSFGSQRNPLCSTTVRVHPAQLAGRPRVTPRTSLSIK